MNDREIYQLLTQLIIAHYISKIKDIINWSLKNQLLCNDMIKLTYTLDLKLI